MSEDLHEIARLTAKATVQETFTALGVNISTTEGIIEAQQDFAWTRSARLTVRKLRMHAITVLVGLLVTGTAYAVWNSIQSAPAARVIQRGNHE